MSGPLPELDYEAVGLRVGLEVHQQLATEHKLFCRCPAGLYTTEHDGVILRHMRPTLSELGVYDGTALMEFKTRKNIVYLLHRDNVCTYEMDDTPPFLVNQRAIDIAIEQCLMLGCDIVDEVHIARKQYLDGSIPTGFQRTAIVGVNGRLPFRGRELSVVQVSVEEDSCREVEDLGHRIVWRTDRLGTPLIETVTGPELRTPDEVEEAILLIGRVCRSTGHVRVGIGASRQDVNVSVRGGVRVEIKGVSQAWRAPALVHCEAVRQVELLRLRDELARRGLTSADTIGVEHRDVTGRFADSQLPFLTAGAWERFLEAEERGPLARGKGPFTVRAIRLAGLAGTLSWPTQPGLDFSSELAGRLRVIATLDQPPILLHSEAWPTGCEHELDALRRELHWGADDAIVIVWGAERDTVTAAEEVRLRYVDALTGVPAETRQPLPDGRTSFERILPGADRMYPDTDSPPRAIRRERVSGLAIGLPDPPWIREDRYRRAGLPVTTIHYLIRRGGARHVDRIVAAGGDLKRVGFFFGEELKGLARDGVAVHEIADDTWDDMFSLVRRRPVLWEARTSLVTALARRRSFGEACTEIGLDRPSTGWREAVANGVGHHSPDGPSDADALRRWLMGLLLADWRGRIESRHIATEIGRHLAAPVNVPV